MFGAAASAGLFDLVVGRTASAADAVASTTGGGVKVASSETLVAQLYGSLKEEQKKILCFPFDHPLRLKVDNNWTIVKQTMKEALTPDQCDLVKQIFMGLHSPEYAQKVFDQVEHDGSGEGSFSAECAMAMFGEPNASASDAAKNKFEFVLTGRHCTRRCDGNSVEGAAFGGPIFYGHAAQGFNEKPDHPKNAYWYQALRANEVYKALDGKQQKIALLDTPRKEDHTNTVKLTGKKQGLPGIPMSELSKDQQGLVKKVLDDLLAPFRKADADEAMKLVEAGGMENLHMAFFKAGDLGNDGIWDVWQVEGPNMVWYFRGAPHVHTWVNIRDPNVKA
ncbi:DUF3500 domain-containing protein [Humisphaera borealis]|uniref:DUF3500 domain-containing protein n=2 Tax=Humisphaera borealis TaxID=2807512 RepID=A0A7M2X3S3_9BACT|nr:DUF3500 domain-containing protein [Humisphaera borealis]